MLREFGLSKKAEFMRVSARKNTAIDEVFQRLGERLIEATPSVSIPDHKRFLSIQYRDGTASAHSLSELLTTTDPLFCAL